MSAYGGYARRSEHCSVKCEQLKVYPLAAVLSLAPPLLAQ